MATRNDENDTHQCRNCRDDVVVSEDSYDVISPCRCRGTMKYIHTECLAQWIATKRDQHVGRHGPMYFVGGGGGGGTGGGVEAYRKCEQCNQEYHISRRFNPDAREAPWVRSVVCLLWNISVLLDNKTGLLLQSAFFAVFLSMLTYGIFYSSASFVTVLLLFFFMHTNRFYVVVRFVDFYKAKIREIGENPSTYRKVRAILGVQTYLVLIFSFMVATRVGTYYAWTIYATAYLRENYADLLESSFVSAQMASDGILLAMFVILEVLLPWFTRYHSTDPLAVGSKGNMFMPDIRPNENIPSEYLSSELGPYSIDDFVNDYCPKKPEGALVYSDYQAGGQAPVDNFVFVNGAGGGPVLAGDAVVAPAAAAAAAEADGEQDGIVPEDTD